MPQAGFEQNVKGIAKAFLVLGMLAYALTTMGATFDEGSIMRNITDALVVGIAGVVPFAGLLILVVVIAVALKYFDII